MSEMKKDTFMQKIRNKGLVYGSAVVIAGCTGLVLLAKGCPGGVPFQARPSLCEPVRGDGICCESESSPFQRNPNGTIKMRAGQPVPNSDYSLEDCHFGDNVCQNQMNLADVRDAAGRPVARIMDKYLDGRAITLPLEDATSQDCVMQIVRDAPCGPLDATHTETINRPRMTGALVLHSLRQRSQEEIQDMHLHPESLRPGDNYFVVINNYEEVCTRADEALPLCLPTSVSACACPNHVDCAPTPCGNGRIDSGERCDQSATPNGCARNQACRGCSTCAPVKQCGNGRIDPGETCDATASPTGCGANQTCAPGCRQCTGGETHSACRNETCVSVPGAGRNACSTDDDCITSACGNSRVDPGEACDPPNSACGTNGRCSSTCSCVETVGQCDAEVTGRFQNRVSSTLLGSPGNARSAAGATDQTVRASVGINVVSGVASVTGISLSCPGCTAGAALPASSISVGGIPIDRSTTCRTTVVVNIPPG